MHSPSSVLTSLIEPGLTTVDIHPFRIGQQAAGLFLKSMAQKRDFQPGTYMVTSELVWRQSSLKGKEEKLKVAV